MRRLNAGLRPAETSEIGANYGRNWSTTRHAANLGERLLRVERPCAGARVGRSGVGAPLPLAWLSAKGGLPP